MRSLLTGHAVWFNRRHRRVGHVFQNRYKSIVCEEEPYFLELVRYIHLNPLRAGVVLSLAELEAYPYSGHSAIVGACPRNWQQTAAVLARFGRNSVEAATAYSRFVLQAPQRGRRPELTGGGLRRSAQAWIAVRDLRRGRECFTHDERILGRPPFVKSLLRQLGSYSRPNSKPSITVQDVIAVVCEATGVTHREFFGSVRTRLRGRAREGITFLWIAHLGRSGHEVAAAMGISPVSAYRCAKRGEADGNRWRAVLDRTKVTEGN